MKQILWMAFVLGTGAGMALAADDGGSKGGPPAKYVPPVMQAEEPHDTVMVLLPGPAPDPPAARVNAGRTAAPVTAAAPATAPRPEPAPTAPTAAAESAPSGMADLEGGPRPYYRRLEHVYPEGFQEDTLKYFQDRIGKITADQVSEVLGKPTRQRAAFGENQKENGTIFAFSDPTGKFREFELDFDGNTGMLRTVFAYPVKMTWVECRKQYGAKVTATDASKGRKFYSYADRRLDVLVGPDGKVVSLGVY